MSSYAHESSTRTRKRAKLSGDDSSEPSISDESALVATSIGEYSTDASDHESDTESELSESSEEPSSEESSEDDNDGQDTEMELEDQEQDGVVNLRANRGKKPVMKLGQEELGPDIRGFLKDFLPQLKAANEELEAQRRAGTLKTVEAAGDEDREQYIEMDLGLGVLEAKDPNADDSTESDTETDTGDGEKEKDILGKLMGRNKVAEPVKIEEVHNTQGS
ncbi:Nn.00g101910.m01.CDS01 [Neocucurbitaria sp. VM-36]